MEHLDRINIADFLPHRSPFLFIDGVEEFVPNTKLVAVKNVAADDHMLVSGEGGELYFPETLIAEAAAQTVLMFSRLSAQQDGKMQELFVLTKLSGEFLKRVVVGDVLKMIVKKVRVLGVGGYADVEVEVLGELIAKIEVFFSLFKGE